jgi:hypothetical protein
MVMAFLLSTCPPNRGKPKAGIDDLEDGPWALRCSSGCAQAGSRPTTSTPFWRSLAWTLRISETARRQLKKLDHSTAQNLLRYLKRLILETEDPRQRGKVLTANLTGLW